MKFKKGDILIHKASGEKVVVLNIKERPSECLSTVESLGYYVVSGKFGEDTDLNEDLAELVFKKLEDEGADQMKETEKEEKEEEKEEKEELPIPKEEKGAEIKVLLHYNLNGLDIPFNAVNGQRLGEIMGQNSIMEFLNSLDELDEEAKVILVNKKGKVIKSKLVKVEF